LLQPSVIEPFTLPVLSLLLFALGLESFTFVVALRELGGWKSIARNRNNTTVLAVLLEDAVALLGILLTLIVALVSLLWGPHPAFDAAVAIAVGALLGAMALFLASINRRLLIDSSDPVLDRAAARFLAEKGLRAKVSSIVVDDDRSVLFVHVAQADAHQRAIESHALGEGLRAHALTQEGKTVEAVYWQFPAPMN
jgi:divalent metal cation (Fe/Co/Zn/Cd) transporter